MLCCMWLPSGNNCIRTPCAQLHLYGIIDCDAAHSCIDMGELGGVLLSDYCTSEITYVCSVWIGMASALAPAVVGQALVDLKCSSPGSSLFSPKGARTPRMNNVVWAQGSWAGGQPQGSRKRKEPGSLPCDQVNGMGDAVLPSNEGGDPFSVQTAALQAMEALLTSVSKYAVCSLLSAVATQLLKGSHDV